MAIAPAGWLSGKGVGRLDAIKGQVFDTSTAIVDS